MFIKKIQNLNEQIMYNKSRASYLYNSNQAHAFTNSTKTTKSKSTWYITVIKTKNN